MSEENTTAEPMFQVGHRIGRYRLVQNPQYQNTSTLRALGEGKTSIVYLVEQELHSGKSILRALKLLKPAQEIINKRRGYGDTYSEGAFLSEIEAISSISHQNIVSIIDSGYEDDSQYFVMPHVDGHTLEECLDITDAAHPTYKWRELVNKDPYEIIGISQQISWALIYLHSNHRYHFDLAPKNVFLREFDSSKVLRPHIMVGDLGVSRKVPPYEIARHSDETMMLHGTRLYMLPKLEQWRDKPIPVSILSEFAPYSDLHALGTLILDMVKGWKLEADRRIRPLKLFANRLRDADRYRMTAQEAADGLERLLPAYVTTAGVEELSSDAIPNRNYINIPLYNAPTSPRVRKILSHPLMTRLQLVPQLLLYRSITPGGVHTSYEHVLGSYTLLLRCLNKLLSGDRFRSTFFRPEMENAQIVILLSRLINFPLNRILAEVSPRTREQQKGRFHRLLENTKEGESLRSFISQTFHECNLESVSAIIYDDPASLSAEQKLISSLHRSSIDVRVMDYLARDSYHASISSGDGLDINMIIDNLIWSESTDRVGIQRNGVFAVEHLLCARYWLFSRLYWNPYNRSISSMLRHLMFSIVETNLFQIEHIENSISGLDEAGALSQLNALWQQTVGGKSKESPIVKLLEMARPLAYRRLVEKFTKNWYEDEGASRVAVKEAENLSCLELERLSTEFYESTSYKSRIEASDILFDVPREWPRKLGEDLSVLLDGRGAAGPKELRFDEVSELGRALPDIFFATTVRVRAFVNPAVIERDRQLESNLREEVSRFLDSKFPAKGMDVVA